MILTVVCGIIFPAVYSLGPPSSAVENKMLLKMSMSLIAIVSFSNHINEKSIGPPGYLWEVGVDARF